MKHILPSFGLGKGGGRGTMVIHREKDGNKCSELDQRDYPSFNSGQIECLGRVGE